MEATLPGNTFRLPKVPVLFVILTAALAVVIGMVYYDTASMQQAVDAAGREIETGLAGKDAFSVEIPTADGLRAITFCPANKPDTWFLIPGSPPCPPLPDDHTMISKGTIEYLKSEGGWDLVYEHLKNLLLL